PLDEQVRGRYHPPVRRADHGRVIADAEDLGGADGQQSLDRGDETELTQVIDGNGEPPACLRAGGMRQASHARATDGHRRKSSGRQRVPTVAWPPHLAPGRTAWFRLISSSRQRLVRPPTSLCISGRSPA